MQDKYQALDAFRKRYHGKRVVELLGDGTPRQRSEICQALKLEEAFAQRVLLSLFAANAVYVIQSRIEDRIKNWYALKP